MRLCRVEGCELEVGGPLMSLCKAHAKRGQHGDSAPLDKDLRP
jgi:hypothetical protein